MILSPSFFFFWLGASFLFGWDGYDYDKEESIFIEKENLVRTYKDIEVYHYGDRSCRNEEVQGFNGNELETYDYNTGEFHCYEMD